MTKDFKIYSNPMDAGGNRAIDYKCKFCEFAPSHLLGIYIDFGGDAGTILICKTCLDRGMDAIDQKYLEEARRLLK